LNNAKRKAYATRCTSNLRQVGVALNLYVQQEACYPLATSGGGFGSWHRALRSSASDDVFFCPQKKKATEDWLALFPSDPDITPHYGYNFIGAARINRPKKNPGLGGDFVFAGTNSTYLPAPENRIVAPAQMIALGDSAAFVKPPASAPPAITRADILYITFPFDFPAWGYQGVGEWHGGGANMLFCDGHAEFAKQSRWLEASAERRRLWNNDHQPHEECW